MKVFTWDEVGEEVAPWEVGELPEHPAEAISAADKVIAKLVDDQNPAGMDSFSWVKLNDGTILAIGRFNGNRHDCALAINHELPRRAKKALQRWQKLYGGYFLPSDQD